MTINGIVTRDGARPIVAVIGNVDIVKFRGWLIEDMASRGYTVVAFAPPLTEGDRVRLAEAGANYQRIDLERTGLNPLQDFLHIIRLSILLRRLKPDVALAHTTKAMIVGSIAAWIARVPRIFAIVEGLGYAFTPSCDRKRRLVRALLAPALKWAFAVCNGVFVLNSDDRAFLVGLGLLSPQQKVVQIAGTGLDVMHYAYVPPSPGPPRFLLIARIIRDKGILEYVEAARIVKSQHPEARFRLLGPLDDHPSAITRLQIAKWEHEDIIEYLGSTDDVRPSLADCTCYVLPSYYREGLPRTILEAMAVGRPVIATNVVGCRDAVENGVTGVLVPPRDAKALALAMQQVIKHPSEYRCAGSLGRRRVTAHFAAAQVNETIMGVLLSKSQGIP